MAHLRGKKKKYGFKNFFLWKLFLDNFFLWLFLYWTLLEREFNNLGIHCYGINLCHYVYIDN